MEHPEQEQLNPRAAVPHLRMRGLLTAVTVAIALLTVGHATAGTTLSTQREWQTPTTIVGPVAREASVVRVPVPRASDEAAGPMTSADAVSGASARRLADDVAPAPVSDAVAPAPTAESGSTLERSIDAPQLSDAYKRSEQPPTAIHETIEAAASEAVGEPTAPEDTNVAAAPEPEVTPPSTVLGNDTSPVNVDASEVPAGVDDAVAHLATLSSIESEFLDAINRERARAGLDVLVAHAVLNWVASERSRDMIENDYFAHFGPDGQSAYALLAEAGMTFSAGGENLAKVGSKNSVEVAVSALMASPTHRANILNARYTFAGIGMETDETGLVIFTTVFSN